MRNDQNVSISTKTTERIHSYNRQTKRLYASRIYARGKERFRLGTDTKQKGAKRPNEQWGLKSRYGSHVNCIQDKCSEHQNDEPQRTYAAIATLY